MKLLAVEGEGRRDERKFSRRASRRPNGYKAAVVIKDPRLDEASDDLGVDCGVNIEEFHMEVQLIEVRPQRGQRRRRPTRRSDCEDRAASGPWTPLKGRFDWQREHFDVFAIQLPAGVIDEIAPSLRERLPCAVDVLVVPGWLSEQRNPEEVQEPV